jgi:transposase
MQAQLNTLTKEELIDKVISLEKETVRIIELEYQLAELKRLIFGTKSERFVSEVPPNQLSFDFGVEQNANETEPQKEIITYERKKKERKEKPVRQAIPSHLRRVEIPIEPEEDLTGAVSIGQEITEVMEMTPAEIYVKRYIRTKYVFPKQEDKGVMIGKLPPQPIDKGIAGASLLTYILIGKYVDHLPIYRQVQRFKREGIQIADSTIYDWITRSCNLLEPLYDLLKQKVIRSSYLQVDETPIPVLDKNKKGSTHRGYHWAYHAVLEKLVLFDYRPGRGREGPEELLKFFKGFLQTDGYAAYEAFDKREGISLVACLAHIRRYFEKSLETDKARSEEVLLLIQELYAIERIAREENLTFEQRKNLRQEKSHPIFIQLGQWVKNNYEKLLPQSPIGKAA